MVITIDSGT